MPFRGTFDHSLDAKNRLTVPAKFRAALSGPLLIAAGIEPCVAVWPAQDYGNFVERALSQLPELSPPHRRLQRFLTANAFDTELDSAGRITVPPRLLEHASLTKETKDTVVIGAESSLEIWDRSLWDEYAAEFSPDQLTEALGHAG